MRLRILIATVVVISCAVNPAFADSSATGQFGEKISVSAKTFKGAQTVVVNGSNFDETVCIYLAYCVLPKKGAAPTPCGGGVNKSGIGDASYWISSNPPPYGTGLAIAFKPGGRFSQQLEVSKKIGTFDCTKVKCAITVRSDHLHQGDRTHDLFIPISFSKK
jgi:hypothetical protein